MTPTHVKNLLKDFYPARIGGFACELGAADGVYLSNTLALEQAGWAVLCIEPNPAFWKELFTNRKHALPMACALEAEAREFTVFGRGITMASGSALTPLPGMIEQCGPGKVITVPTAPLAWCLRMAGFPRLDFLSLDVEGGEIEVLDSMLPYHPKGMLIETGYQADEIKAWCRRNDYVVVEEDGNDTFFFDKDELWNIPQKLTIS